MSNFPVQDEVSTFALSLLSTEEQCQVWEETPVKCHYMCSEMLTNQKSTQLEFKYLLTDGRKHVSWQISLCGENNPFS